MGQTSPKNPCQGADAKAPTGETTSCTQDKVRLVEVAEVVDTKGTRKPVVTRKQYINLDDKVGTDGPHPEYGRKIKLQARIEWVSGDKSRSLAGHSLYWYSKAGGGNKAGLSGTETEGFAAAGAGSKSKAVQTGSDGWTPVIEFFTSQYGGDVFSVFVTDSAAYSGGLSGGVYTVWRKFWYQVTEMDDGTGTGSVFALPAAVTNPFEAGYQTVFIEFHEVAPRNKATYIGNLVDGTARSNAAKPYFANDKLVPFKAHIMTVDYSQTPSHTQDIADTMSSAIWTSSGWHLLWRLDPGALSWKISAQYRRGGASGTWKDIPNANISTVTHPTQKGFKQLKVDFAASPVLDPGPLPMFPSPHYPVDIKFQIKVAGPNISLGWGGGSHHLFLCTGSLHDIDESGNWDLIQRSDCVHEIGHALGLVNLKPVAAGTQAWEDTTHANHCIKPPETCAMWWQSSTTRLTTFHLDHGAGCHDYLRRQDFSRSVMENSWKD